ncbi:MAG: hypothetical protein E7160_02375 [Firmicutes bacterium]|nr:hypothetical protein [Bacillota bacterium]
MFCPNCGKDNKDGKLGYCLSCGTSFNSPNVERVNTSTDDSTKSKASFMNAIIILDAIFITLALVLNLASTYIFNFTREDYGFAYFPKSLFSVFVDIFFIIIYYITTSTAVALTFILIIAVLGKIISKLFKR